MLRCWVIFFPPRSDYDREQFAENSVPLLLIGTKFDQIAETKRTEVLTRTAFLSEDFNAEEINLVGELFNSTSSRLKPVLYRIHNITGFIFVWKYLFSGISTHVSIKNSENLRL